MAGLTVNIVGVGLYRRSGLERGQVLPALLPLADAYQTLSHRRRLQSGPRVDRDRLHRLLDDSFVALKHASSSS